MKADVDVDTVAVVAAPQLAPTRVCRRAGGRAILSCKTTRFATLARNRRNVNCVSSQANKGPSAARRENERERENRGKGEKERRSFTDESRFAGDETRSRERALKLGIANELLKRSRMTRRAGRDDSRGG